MSTYRLDKLFAPASLALVGASDREGSVSLAVLRNLREAGFPGRIDLVNPRSVVIDGLASAASLAELETAPELVIVASPAASVPAVIIEAGRRGAAAALVMTAGLGQGPGSLAEAVRLEARKHGLRLVGPNCLGVMAPHARLNASFAAQAARPGDLALVSQSGAVAAGLVEWSAQRNIGLSAVVSLGDQVDVDFADCLDYFAADQTTRAILLYIESIGDAQKFMSAARA